MLEFSKIGGRYSVIRTLYQRGAGFSLLARDERDDRKVVIDALALERGADFDQQLENRQQATATLRALDHPNLSDVQELVFEEPHLYLVKTWEPGQPLREWLESDQPGSTWPLAISLCRDLIEGLAAMHSMGLLHRDLRPRSVWLRTAEGRPRVQISHFDETLLEDSRDQRLVGDPRRRAPEVVRSRDYSRRSDVYAAGLLLFEILTAGPRAPQESSTILGSLDEATLAKVPPPYADVVRRASRPFEVERFDDALDLLAAFDALDLQRRLQEAGLQD